MRTLSRFTTYLCIYLCSLSPLLFAQGNCDERTKEYNTGRFEEADFLSIDQGIDVGDAVTLDTDQELDLENILLGLDQPFFVDYLEEGAGASHLFGFFFWDIDTDRDGVPDFLETGDFDDLDGDGLLNHEDDDDDNDGIPDSMDRQPPGINSMPASFYRQGEAAAANGLHPGDYWQFVPNSVLTDGPYAGNFEHPGAYLYVDNNNNQTPDILEYSVGENTVPPYVVDKGWTGYHDVLDSNFPGMLGVWPYAGTLGTTVDDKFHWVGSTIFYIADDDNGTGQTSRYGNHSPYGLTYSDISSSADANPDYDIYGTTDPSDPRIPSFLKNDNGTPADPSDDTFKIDNRGVPTYKYRWYESNISGGRELVFFLVVFWGSGGSDVNTYYSKSGFNLDDAPTAEPTRNVTGDAYGDNPRTNWFPAFRSSDAHNDLTQRVFGVDWSSIATSPIDGSRPIAHNTANQEWVDEWQNWDDSNRVIQYRALRDWFSGSPIDADAVINGRYGISMAAENDSSVIRAINGKMAHLMVGAPQDIPNAILLGWEDLFGDNTNDRDYEDVAFYVKREAGGQLQSLNVADDLDEFEDASLSQITFTFTDNFTESNWGREGRYVNYYYRLASVDEWIPLLGGRHERTVDLFQPEFGGSTTANAGEVTRTVTIEVQDKKREIYWKVEMATDNVDTFTPKVTDATINYQTLIHDFYYNNTRIPNSEIAYISNLESPDPTWLDITRNRGHLYAQQLFEHGNPPNIIEVPNNASPEQTPESQPVEPFKWDAGVTMKQALDTGANRTMYSFYPAAGGTSFSNNLTRINVDKDNVTNRLVNLFQLSDDKNDGVWVDNYHDPAAVDRDPESAALWLINWLHGYTNPIIDSGTVLDRGVAREWILGGMNRPSPLVLRAPGLPNWISGRDIPVRIKREYLNFIDSDAQRLLPTRVIVATEGGMIHCIDAGRWTPEKRNEDDVFADGHYLDYGTGGEVWSMIPHNLLNDVKYNYTGANPITARIESTPVSRVIRFADGSFRRIVVFTQGFQGGSHQHSGDLRTGNSIWVVDITDVDNPIPLWQRTIRNAQDIVNPPAIGWAEINNTPTWVVTLSSGGSGISGTPPRFFVFNAETGDQISGRTKTVAGNGEVMLGGPAMVDTDNNGYVDHLVGATSEGRVFAYNLNEDTSVRYSAAIPNARFFLTPTVRVGPGGEIIAVVPSGDNPYVYDEGEYADGPNFQNSLYAFLFDTQTRTWNQQDSVLLPRRHKVFSRPLMVNDRIVLGTTTGDTPNICDVIPDDPGDIILLDLADLTNIVELDSIEGIGAVIAPSAYYGGGLFVHKNTTFRNNPGEDAGAFDNPWGVNVDENGDTRQARMQFDRPPPTVIASVFGVMGAQDTVLQKLLSNLP